MRPRAMGGGVLAAFTNAATTVADRVTGAMREIHGKNLSRDLDWYAYSLLFSALNNGDSSTQSLQIQSDSAFIWTHAVAVVTSDDVGLPFLAYEYDTAAANGPGVCSVDSWPLRVEITDGGLQRQLVQRETALSAIFGRDASRPGELARPRLFKPNSSIQVSLRRWAEGQREEDGTASDRNLTAELVFIGYKLFDVSRLNLTK